MHYNPFQLQQHLPFTVLKRITEANICCVIFELQQHLPFTVLKLKIAIVRIEVKVVATAPTVYGIETDKHSFFSFHR